MEHVDSAAPVEATTAGQPAAETTSWRVRVILNEPIGLLDYRVPPELQNALRPGVAVVVPLGRRRANAYVASVLPGEHPGGIAMKDIEGLDNERPALPAHVMDLLLFAADYYAATPGDVLQCALPAMARPKTTRYRITAAAHAATVTGADATVLALGSRFPRGFTVVAVARDLISSRSSANARLRKLTALGLVEKIPPRRTTPRQDLYVQRLVPPASWNLTAKQAVLAQLLALLPDDQAVPVAPLQRQDPNVRPRLKALEKLGLVGLSYVARDHTPFAFGAPLESTVTPTPQQAEVITALTRAIDLQTFSTVLLHGVTGSGKTEVYLRAIAHALKQQRTALILVPEIALTPQLGDLFRQRFGNLVATFHSGLSAAERQHEWERVALGEATIGLGARSALFLPLENLAVIIVDEEHETSFKQDETPRYNARDLAVVRGRMAQAVVVLGSATPSLETSNNAQCARYSLLTLPARVTGRPLPTVECINLASEERIGEKVFTVRLARALERTLTLGEQAILFLNRRGFAPYVYCQDCGHAYRCDSCDVSLTLHRRRNILMCHYCGFETAAPDSCAACSGHRVGAFGLGTEKVEAEVRALFGNINILRLDRDVVRKKSDLAAMVQNFRERRSQVLIGTQMVAKGHDFPGVTLVGVIAADASLNFPDFRAAERTFQLITQVAGRAGRGNAPGYVLVQAYEMDHYAIATARHHDYATFLERELQARRELGYPPFAHLALLRFEGPDEAQTLRAAQEHADALLGSIGKYEAPVVMLGPAAAPLARLREQWRFHVLLKGKNRGALRRVLQYLPKVGGASVRRVLDVDPMNML